MKITVTGALGNVGIAVLDELARRDHDITAVDIKNRKNRKSYRYLKKSISNMIWGDIRNDSILKKSLTDADCVIHLAALVPPVSESDPVECESVNVDGTRHIISTLLQFNKVTPLLYISSAGVIGPVNGDDLPVYTSHAANPNTVYGKSKLMAETAVTESGLKYCILRLASVLDSGTEYDDDMLKLLFEFPLDAKTEVIMDIDAATAIVNSAELLSKGSRLDGSLFFIGGGRKNGCQINNRIMISRMFDAMGIGMLAKECFNPDSSSFYMTWYDTEEGNDILKYQNHTFDDYLGAVRKKTESGGVILKSMAPRLRNMMQMQSPYYQKILKEKNNV